MASTATKKVDCALRLCRNGKRGYARVVQLPDGAWVTEYELGGLAFQGAAAGSTGDPDSALRAALAYVESAGWQVTALRVGGDA